MKLRSRLAGLTIVLLAASVVLASCKKKDEISAAKAADRKDGVAAPGVEATKAIAEEAYIYGFPMIAAYKAMYEFNVDKTNSQYKAPFNEIWNDSKVFTPKDTAIVTPNS